MADEKEEIDLDRNPQRRPSCTYEDVIDALGGFRKFQFIQVALCALNFLLVSFTNLGFVFIGRTPDHVCKAVNESETLSRYGLLNDSTASLSYGKCEVTVTSNQSGLPVSIASFDCLDGRHFPGGEHQTLVSQWDLVCEYKGQAELGQTLFIAGQIIGGFFLGPVADRFGRKLLIVICSMLCTAIEFSITFSPNIYTVWALLFVDGIVLIVFNNGAFILGVEFLRPRQRATYGVAMCMFWTFCIMIVALAGYIFEEMGWRYFQAFGSSMGLFLLLYPFFLSESPRWLASKNRSKEALAILQKACKQNNVDFTLVKEKFLEYMYEIHHRSDSPECNNGEINARGNQMVLLGTRSVGTDSSVIEDKIPIQKMTHYSVLILLRHRYSCVILCASWYIWITHNVTYYGIYMTSTSLSGSKYLNFCLLALVEIPSNLSILYLFTRLGRLVVMRIFLLLATLSLLGSSLTIAFAPDTSLVNIVSTILFILGKFAITASFNAIFTFTPEIYPTVVRASAFGACKGVSRVGSLVAPYFRPLYDMHPWAPGVIFSSLCVIALAMVSLLPETSDRILPTTIEEMKINQKMQKNPKINAESGETAAHMLSIYKT